MLSKHEDQYSESQCPTDVAGPWQPACNFSTGIVEPGAPSLEQARRIPVFNRAAGSASVNRGRVTDFQHCFPSPHRGAYICPQTDIQAYTCTCTPHTYILKRKRVMTEPPVPHFWGTPPPKCHRGTGVWLNPFLRWFSAC